MTVPVDVGQVQTLRTGSTRRQDDRGQECTVSVSEKDCEGAASGDDDVRSAVLVEIARGDGVRVSADGDFRMRPQVSRAVSEENRERRDLARIGGYDIH